MITYAFFDGGGVRKGRIGKDGRKKKRMKK